VLCVLCVLPAPRKARGARREAGTSGAQPVFDRADHEPLRCLAVSRQPW
jgi:hypothetical protein